MCKRKEDIKKHLKGFMRCYRSCYCVLQRTILKSINHIKIPFLLSKHIGNRVSIGKNTRIYNHNRKSRLEIEADTILNQFCKIVMVGGSLKIGYGCTFGEYNIFNVFDEIVIGDEVVTADNVSFITNTHNYQNINMPVIRQGGGTNPIQIGAGCWIGINVSILSGTSIGKNCVVGANSVVKGSFPDYCVIAGNPARIVKKYNFEIQKWERISERKEIFDKRLKNNN